MTISVRGFLVGWTVALLAGCASLQFDPPVRADTHEEVGSIHFSVLSVGDWESYKETLQPKFGLKSSDALTLAMTPTRTLEESLVDAVRLSAALQGERDTTSTTRTDSSTLDNVAETVTSDTTSTTRTETTGPLTDGAPTAPTANALPSDLRAQIPTLGTAPNTEPVLKYQNASAIYQAVQLMDRYITDAARRKGWRAHVVTLQVSVLPSARRRPYDAYANITFRAVRTREGAARADGTTVQVPVVEPIIPFSDDSLDFESADLKLDSPTEGAFKDATTMVVVPLIATDQLETTVHSRQTDQIQQLALSLALLQGNLGLGSDFQRFTEKLRRALGRDVNSLLTVARLTDDTVRIRMGAMQSIDTDYALVPRTHMVSLLLLTPGDKPDELPINALMQSEFRDVETGEALKPRSRKAINKAARAILAEFDKNATKGIDDAGLAKLIMKVNEDPGSFKEALPQEGGLREFSEHIRLSFATLYVGSQYGTTQFAIPPKPADPLTAIAAPSAPYALLDDGKKAVLTIDAGGKTLVAENLARTTLQVGTRVQLLPSAVSIDAANKRATITFVPTKKLKVVTGEQLTFDGRPVHVVDVEEEKKPGAGVSIASGAQMIWANDKREGTALVRVDFPDATPAKQVVLTITGADVASASCVPACTASGGTYTVSADAAVSLSLANLGTAVTVTGVGQEKADPVSITLPVVSLPTPVPARATTN